MSMGAQTDTGPDLTDLLLTAPFMSEAKMALGAGRSIWLSVESWPPRYGKALLDAMALCPPSTSCRTLRLRLPTEITNETPLQLGAQVASQVMGDRFSIDGVQDLSGWLDVLARQGPIQVLLYGTHSLAAVRSLMDPKLMTELDRLPMLIVLMSLPMPGAPRLAVRLLSSRGERPIVGRVHTVKLSSVAASSSPHELKVIIDQVDDLARKLLDLVASHGALTSAFLSEHLNMPVPRVEHSIRGLLGTGLIIREEASIRLRDDQILSTLKAFRRER
jgi:hypothetical protein